MAYGFHPYGMTAAAAVTVGKMGGKCVLCSKLAKDSNGNVTLKTPMSVEATGDRLGDVLYTVYSYDGKVLVKESKKLELPKEDIDGCLVKIKITWGKKDTSYLEEDYWFAAMYNIER